MIKPKNSLCLFLGVFWLWRAVKQNLIFEPFLNLSTMKEDGAIWIYRDFLLPHGNKKLVCFNTKGYIYSQMLFH
jgi:hypothetical protein